MRKKLVLMGRSGCGKTSMRSVIFSGYRPNDTARLGTTVGLEHTHINFLTSLKLNLWDCGGQDTYIDGWLNRRADEIFTGVQLLVYVYDVRGDKFEMSLDENYFRDCVNVLQRLSPGTPVICLLHKMDLIRSEDQEDVFESVKARLEGGGDPRLRDRFTSPNVRYFPTSIHDESLYKAWSRIMRTLIPEYVSALEDQLTSLARVCSASEIVLLEYSTLLLISRGTAQDESQRGDQDAAHSPGSEQARSVATSDYDSDSSDLDDRSTPHSMASYSPSWDNDYSDSGSAVGYPTLSPNRFETITTMVKKLRDVARRQQSNFAGLEIRTGSFTVYMDQLTRHMIILVVVADPSIQLSAIKINVDMSRAEFVRQENESLT